MPRRKSKRGKEEVPITSLTYKGPIQNKKDVANDDTISIVLVWDQAITAAGTVINNTWTMNNPANCVDWGDYSSSWDQYRVLGLRVAFFPNSKYTNPTTNTYAPLATVVDRDTSSSLSSYAAADNYASLKMFTLDSQWYRDMKMSGVSEAQFFNTQSVPSSGGGIKLFASGLSNVSFGRILAYYRIQFEDEVFDNLILGKQSEQ